MKFLSLGNPQGSSTYPQKTPKQTNKNHTKNPNNKNPPNPKPKKKLGFD